MNLELLQKEVSIIDASKDLGCVIDTIPFGEVISNLIGKQSNLIRKNKMESLAFTPGGSFNGRTGRDNILSDNKILLFDLDLSDDNQNKETIKEMYKINKTVEGCINQDLKIVRDMFTKLNWSFLIRTSFSGCGLHCYVTYDNELTLDERTVLFERLMDNLINRLSETFLTYKWKWDKATKNVNRLDFINYNPRYQLFLDVKLDSELVDEFVTKVKPQITSTGVRKQDKDNFVYLCEQIFHNKIILEYHQRLELSYIYFIVFPGDNKNHFLEMAKRYFHPALKYMDKKGKSGVYRANLQMNAQFNNCKKPKPSGRVITIKTLYWYFKEYKIVY